MKYLLKSILLLLLFLFVISKLHAQTDTLVEVDTIYLPADTIKKVHTVIVYEEYDSKTNSVSKKKKNTIAYFVGPNLGVNLKYMYPVIGGLQFTFVRNHYFASISANYQSKYSYIQSFQKSTIYYNQYIDTIKTLVDEFVQIIGEDTIRTPVYNYSYISRIDTLEKITEKSAKNSYRNIAIPITVGYCKKTKKYMYGIAVGGQFRFLFPSEFNKFILNDSIFVPEKPYLRRMNFDAMIQGIARQKIYGKLWLSESCSFYIPLLDDYKKTQTKLYKTQYSILFGVNYFF